MDYFYTVVLLICIFSMFALALDVGRNTILSKTEIKWFKITFLTVALGSICEWAGAYFDGCQFKPYWFHAFVTLLEFCIAPFLTVLLARSCGIIKSLKTFTILFTVHALSEIILLPFGKIFYIDSTGIFQRGDLYSIYLIICVISFLYIMSIFGIIGRKNTNHNPLVIIFISIIFILGQLATILDGTIKTGFISISIITILLYVYEQNIIRRQMINTIDMEQSISNHDVLTGVCSRISFERKVQEINNQIKKNGENLVFCLCECDLNNLKVVNDSFGHDVGDNYIKNCCKSISNIFNGCPLYRIGGDEFVIILEGESVKNYEQIKKIIRNFCMAEAAKKVDLFEKQFFAAGFAKYNKDIDKSLSDVLKRADIDMYANKKMLKQMAINSIS